MRVNNETYSRLTLETEKTLLPCFNMLLQKGVTIGSRVGCSVAAFLHHEIGASLGTIEKIQSIMLDGKPVDDLNTAIIKDRSTLALSAAMPGLVGATLRRGGAYASFRSGITSHETGHQYTVREGLVQIKLFNLLMAELGPELLRRGVIVCPGDLARFAAAQSGDFWQGCRRVILNGVSLDAGRYPDAEYFEGEKEVFLSVLSDQGLT